MIRLACDTIDRGDIERLIEWLQTNPRLTKGPLTVTLEDKWSNWLGREYSVFCNSGSSANLLMFQALLEGGHIAKGDRIVVPTLSWATTLAPVMQLGLEPILCDCNLENLSVSLPHLTRIFQEKHPRALILVPALGLAPDMDNIVDLCEHHAVILLEDTCGSMGAQYKGRKLGTFGLMSSFSLYFGHHISTIEGGFVTTDDRMLHNILKSVRSHGWARDLDEDERAWLRKEWGVTAFNDLFTFYYTGFNVRATDLQAFMGLGQIDKLDGYCQRRNEIFWTYYNQIHNNYWKPRPCRDSFTSSLAYPVIHPARDEIVKALQDNDIETRPLLCRPMGVQPFYVKRYGSLELPNAIVVGEYGFYVPIHASLEDKEIHFVCETINHITNESHY